MSVADFMLKTKIYISQESKLMLFWVKPEVPKATRKVSIK